MKKQFFVTLLVALFAAFTVAWAQDSTQEAAVRVVHLVPNGPNVDIYLNGEPALPDLAAGTVSGYVSVPAGQYDVEVVAAGQGLQPTGGAQPATTTTTTAVPAETGTLSLQTVSGLIDQTEQAINAQDYQGAQDLIEEAQQEIEDLGGNFSDASTAAQQQVQENLQSAQEALDQPDPQIALTALDQARQALAQVEAPAGGADAVGAVGAVGNTVGQAVTGGADAVGQAVTGAATGLGQAVTGGVAGVQNAVTGGVAPVVGQDVQTSIAALPGLFGTIRETINAQDYELAQDQIEEAQQTLQNLQTGADEARDQSVEAVITNLQASQEALDTPDAEVALTSLDQAEQGYGELDTAAIENENAVAATGGAVGVAPVDTVGQGAVTGGVAGQDLQASVANLPTLFTAIRESINAQDFEGAQDQIEEAQQSLEGLQVGAATDESVQQVQETLQVSQEALDTPDAAVALDALDQAEQQYGQIDVAGIESAVTGDVTDTTVDTDVDAAATDTTAATAGVQEGVAIATSTITLEPGQYYTVVATQTQAALEGRINISAQPGQAEINVTGPNGYAESFVGSRQLEALTPGNYIIAGTLTGYQSAQQQVQAEAGQTLAADLALQPLTQAQVAATPGGVTGGATGGAQAAGFAEQPPLVQLLVFNDSLDLPPAGQALVRVVHASPDAPAVNIIAEAQQEGAVTGGAMTGGAETGAMNVTFDPAGAVVNITGPDGFTQELTSSQTLDGLAPGEYVVAATLEGYQPSETRITVAAGETVPVEIILEATPQGSSPQGRSLVSAFFPSTAMLGLQLDQELSGYVDRALASLDSDVNAAQQDLRAALLAVQAQLEGATGDAQRALQNTEARIQEALTALDNDDAESARQSLEALQGAQTGGVTDTATGAVTGGADVSAQTGDAVTGGAATGGAATTPAPAQPQGSALVSSLQTGNASDYVAVPAGTYQLQVQTADGGNVVLDIPNSTLESGVVYTFYAFGSATQGTLAVNVSVDALVAQQLR